MEIILGFILLILLIGFIASGKFSRLAESKGYPSKKAKNYPWFIAGSAIFLTLLGQTLMSFADRSLMAILFTGWGCVVFLAMLVILKKAFKNMQSAPDAGCNQKSNTPN